jgi:hypothetical protein
MTDEQRDRLVDVLGQIDEQSTKNKLETTYEEVKHQLLNFIERHRIRPEDLYSYKIREVVMECTSMTILTSCGRYVHVSAESGLFAGHVELLHRSSPDIEHAYNMGILSKKQYDRYKKAQQGYLGRHKVVDARDRLGHLVREVGAANVQEFLNEHNQ